MTQKTVETVELVLQTVTITLSDGRTGQFLGNLLVTPLDSANTVVADIKFSEPQSVDAPAELIALASTMPVH